MLAALKVITPPASPVVDPATMAAHARIDGDDDMLALYRDAATAAVEKHLGRALITQTLRWTVSQAADPAAPFPYVGFAALGTDAVLRRLNAGVLDLPYGPVQSVTAVSIGEWGEPDTDLAAGTDYTVDLATDPARLRLDPRWTWGTYNHLSATYVAGYGGMGSVPQPIVAAVLLAATSLYEHRGDDAAEPGLSRAARALLSPYRVHAFAG